MKFRSKVAAAAALTAALLAPGAVGVAGAQEGDDATITVVHGIPGGDLGLADDLPVDVLVNGETCLLTDFRFTEVSDRVQLAPGTYDIQVLLSDGECGGAVAIDAPGVEVPAGVNASVVAHLDTEGAPTASVYVNDLSAAGLYRARVAVHHTADAPAVDVTATRTFEGGRWSNPFVHVAGLENPDQAVADTWVGPYEVELFPAGADEAVFTAPVSLVGKYYAVYAVGSLDTGSFTLIVDAQDFG
jgi:hypothetical protein